MVAAIYARKSTVADVADEQKSTARQVEHARAFAARRGWTVAEPHVYVDDGISGAEFANRPGYVRLLNALTPRAPFNVLIVSELSRLGREQLETGYFVKQVSQAGVKIFAYLEDREILLDTPTDKFLMSAVNFAGEIEREKARQRMVDTMLRKARAGHVTGGSVFGYDNVKVCDGNGARSHVERRINVEEAAVVRRIFALVLEGLGLRAIAKRLNEERVPAPRPQQQRPRGWASSSVREVLRRPLYRGVIVWNRTQKRDAWGQKRRRDRPAGEWVEIPAPELRIVAEDVWTAVHARLANARANYLRATDGAVWGRPASALPSKYLLTGLARCGQCGGSLVVLSRGHGTGKKRRQEYFYACSTFHHRGHTICANRLSMRMTVADDAVLSAIEAALLAPKVIEGAIKRAIAKLQPAAAARASQRRALEQQLQQLETETSRLTEALAIGGGELGVLVAALKTREARRQAIALQLEASVKPTSTNLDATLLERLCRQRLADWRGLLRARVVRARSIVRQLVGGRITFTPDVETHRFVFQAPATLARFFVGIVDAQGVASPDGSTSQCDEEIRGLVDAA